MSGKADLDELKRMLEAAELGRLKCRRDYLIFGLDECYYPGQAECPNEAVAEYIAAAVNALPGLIAGIEMAAPFMEHAADHAMGLNKMQARAWLDRWGK